MDPSRRHLLPATLHRRRSPSPPPQLRRTSATPLANQSDGGGSGCYPSDLNPSSWSLGRTVGTSSPDGSSSRTPPNAFSIPGFAPPSPAAPAIRLEGGPVGHSFDLNELCEVTSQDGAGHLFDLNEPCGVTSDSEGEDGPEAGQVDNGPVDGRSVQSTVRNSLVPDLNSETSVLEQPALPLPLPAPSPAASGGAGSSRRSGSGDSPRPGGAVKRSRATPEANHASPGEGGASPREGGAVTVKRSRARATPAASHAHASPVAGGAGSGGASPAAGGGGNNGASPALRAGGAVKRSRATPGASHASPGEGGAVKRSRATPAASHAHASPGAGRAGSSSASAGPGGAGSSRVSIGSSASAAAGGGGNNGASPGVGGAGSSISTTGRGAAALLELARELKLSEAHTQTIMKDQGLAKLVLTNPERARRRLRNRRYAAMDRINKANRKEELEQMVETLTNKITTLSTALSQEQSKRLQIRTTHNELRLKVHSMENMAQLRDAEYKALTAEKNMWLAQYEVMNSRTPNTSCQGPKR